MLSAGSSNAGWIGRTQGVRMDDIFLQLEDGRNDFTVRTRTETEDSRWHHVAFVVDRDSQERMRAYVDGVDVTDEPKQANVRAVGSIDVSTPACIGERGSKGRTWNGALDDIRVYSRALPGLALEQLHAAELKHIPPPVTLAFGTVLEVDGRNLSLVLDSALPAGTALRGQLIRLTAETGSGHFAVDRVAPEGRGSRVFIDPSTGSFARNTGLIEEIVTPHTFITSTYFRHGNWGEMHEGDVVLVGDEAFRIAQVDDLGWKKCNSVRVTLDSDAFHDQRGQGGKFIVSAAAPGDRWDMELIVRIRRLKDSTYSVTCPLDVSVRAPPGAKLNPR